jgi:hypothetical protein
MSGTIRTGISTASSPAGILISVRASLSVSSHPWTTRVASAVVYTVGEPVGLERGSLPMNVRRIALSLDPDCEKLR